jgi:HSP20 family protein
MQKKDVEVPLDRPEDPSRKKSEMEDKERHFSERFYGRFER